MKRVPDHMKPICYWEIQFEIAKANEAGDEALELALIAEQNAILA